MRLIILKFHKRTFNFGGKAMSSEVLISSMEKLIKLHKSLYELAVRKTDIVAQGDLDALNQLVADENKHVSAINKIEKERSSIVAEIVPNIENATITDCLEQMSEQDKLQIQKSRDELLNILAELKNRNTLNQQLIRQSLQFVNMNISLLIPQPENFNYGPPANTTKKAGAQHGLFNSKA